MSLTLFLGVRRGDVDSEVGKLDAPCDYSDVSWGCTDPNDEVLVLLVWPASECADSVKNRCFNA